MKTAERRYLNQETSEVRDLSIEGEGEVHITGKGIVFNMRSQNLGGFVEFIDAKALEGARIEEMKCFFNHNADYTLASLRNKTVSLTITEGSADYDITAPDNQTIRDLVLSPIKRGDITGSSFMFDIDAHGDEWEEGPDGVYVRYIKRIANLYEMGPVSTPAYLQTTSDVGKRSLDQFIQEVKQKEVHLRRLNAERRLRYYTH
jgi:HK97 family phage prohead protease